MLKKRMESEKREYREKLKEQFKMEFEEEKRALEEQLLNPADDEPEWCIIEPAYSVGIQRMDDSPKNLKQD